MDFTYDSYTTHHREVWKDISEMHTRINLPA